MAFNSSTTSKIQAQHLTEQWLKALNGVSFDSVTGLTREGGDLMLVMSDGRQVLLPDAFDVGHLLEMLADFPEQIQSLIAAMQDGATVLVAQAGAVTLPLPQPSNSDGAVIGRVAEANGDVKVQRNGTEQSLKSGDNLLQGDVILTSQSAQMRLELLSDQSKVTGSGVVGENSRLVLGKQAATSMNIAPVVQVDAGTVLFDRLTDAMTTLQVITPTGAVLPQGQGVGVTVSAATGQTTIVGLTAFGVTTGTGSAVQFIPSAPNSSPVSIPMQGLVFNTPNSLGQQESAGLMPSSSVVPTGSQVTAIAQLVTSPSANLGRGDLGGLGLLSSQASSTLSGVVAPSSVSTVSTSPTTATDRGLSGGAFSGVNTSAPFSSGTNVTSVVAPAAPSQATGGQINTSPIAPPNLLNGSLKSAVATPTISIAEPTTQTFDWRSRSAPSAP